VGFEHGKSPVDPLDVEAKFSDARARSPGSCPFMPEGLAADFGFQFLREVGVEP
jgi:hypothetical protein